MTVQSKIIISLVTVLIIVNAYLFTNVYLIEKQYLKIMPHTYAEFDFNYTKYDLSREEAKRIVDNEFSKFYVIKYHDLSEENLYGECKILTHRVFIHDSVDGWLLLEVLTHELVHLKYRTGDETFTQFKTFQIMWESENPILNERAKAMAIHMCTHGAHMNTEYDCSYYILKYLKNSTL